MVDNLTFDDGEPITNNKLQSLYNAIKNLEGDIAKTSIVNTTTQVKYTPIVWAGTSALVTIPAAGANPVPVPISFQGFQTDSIYVTATPRRSSLPKNGAINWVIQNVSKSGATILFNNTDKDYKGSTYFDFIAVEMKQSS